MSPAPEQAAAQACEQAIRRAWRRLTGGKSVRDPDRPTLVACSGGADSSALAIALASTPALITLGHVVHDIRSRENALRDRNAVRELGDRLGRPVLDAEIQIAKAPGNLEANAREARYRALHAMAADCSAAWIATAHHADDVLETMLMRLIRGAGPRGLGAIAPRLESDPEQGRFAVVRPCLGVARDELVEVCRAAGWSWREDATNADESRLRAALRARVTPELRRLAPCGAKRAAENASLYRDAQRMIETRAAQLRATATAESTARVWSRDALRGEPGAVIGEVFTRESSPHPLDPGLLRDIIEAIRDETTDPRCFNLGSATLRVLAREIRLEPRRE